ncbi:MAG TPA: uroporphyrinogen-III synthase [Nitrosomonas sp.]|nr:uroporphyrinogen-III synthase [Nitrosomonas sp.]
MPALSGLSILVTRPAHQATYLVNRIKSLGGEPLLFPVLEITDVEDIRPLLSIIDRLHEFDFAIFVSPNAVDKALPLICKNTPFPSHLKVAVVGKGSAQKLSSYGIDKVILPAHRFDSEALLELEILKQVQQKRIVIFRGNEGRKLLGETLTNRSAIVEYAECYQRNKPKTDVSALLAYWSRGSVHAVTITSSEGLHNLFDMVGEVGQQLLKNTPFFTAHERIAEIAKDLGLKDINLTESGDDGLIAGLLSYFNR